MGVGEKLKDIYYIGEEKWYAFWDKVDEHLPVYGIIDSVDNVIPSFALFLILIFLILLMALFGVFALSGTQDATLKLTIVEGGESRGVAGAKVIVEGIDQEFFSNDFGVVESIKVPFNSNLTVTAQKDERTRTEPIYIDDYSKVYEMNIGAGHFSSQKSIMFKTENGDLATGSISLTYSCSSGITPPQSETIYNGTANVSYTEDCGTLYVDVSSPKYASKTFTLSQPSNIFTLEDLITREKVKVTVNLKYNGALITDAVAIQAFISTSSYSPTETKPATNGQAQFELLEGDYFFKVRQELGYKAKSSLLVSLTQEGGQETVDIVMEKNLVGYIKATAKEGTTPLADVYITLSKKLSSGTANEINNQDTNSTGEATFALSETGSFLLTATKEGYCDKSADANIGDSILLSMVRNNGQCGNKLMVKVVDQDGKPVTYAKVVLFGAKEEDEYKLPYIEKVTDYNGYVEWNPIQNSKAGETYKVFAFKAIYSGWSEAKEFNSKTAAEVFTVRLEVPLGKVIVSVKDIDNLPIQFAEVQLFDEYIPANKINNPVSGKRMVENADGTIEFNIKADKKVYAQVKKEGYESYTTIPIQVIGSATTGFEVTLVKPPVAELAVNALGLYKNGLRVMKVEAGQEYDALFEIIAPKDYDELGFFVMTGKDNVTKTELDKLYIKETMAPAKKLIRTGATYTKPKGYSTDEKYLNLEESKWSEIRWTRDTYTVGKIIVGVKVKIRPTAQLEERLDIGYRAWGIFDGYYERDLLDSELGRSQNSNVKQELYASLKWQYVSVGTETLCEQTSEEKSFCITSTYTDPENFTRSFTDAFDAQNNSTYSLSIKVMNNSTIGFDNAKTLLENPEENLMLGTYAILTPKYTPVNGTINAYKTDWIDTPGFVRNSSIDIVSLKVTPQKTGTGIIKLRIREGNSLVFEKPFTLNIVSDKKMNVKFMSGTSFVETMPKIVSGKTEQFTIKLYNTATGIEIEGAIAKIYDRFGTIIAQKTTNKLGLATMTVPASFPGEKLKLQVEKPEYETLIKEFNIAEDVIEVDPSSLAFTVNPQNKKEDKKTVKITNLTGLDLAIKEIKVTGKLKGLLNESQMESYYNTYIGTKIASQDFEELVFKVISSDVVPTAEDITATIEITVGAEGKSWVKEVEVKVRVGLGKDVDNPACLEITKKSWEAVTRGNMVEVSFEIKNNCVVESKPVSLKNLGAMMSTSGSVSGTFTAQSSTALVELGTAYSRVFKPVLNPGAKIPVTVKFTPSAGSSGTATGSIVFEASNPTDSKSQKLTAEMTYNILYENLQDCIVIGADLITISAPGSGSFSITNSCKTKADFQLNAVDLQGALSNKSFTLNAGESKDVSVAASEGQIPGAYNILVNARQATTKLELVGSVKVIIEDDASCFKLSRYQYDIFDSPFTENDGTDRGYLRNECVEKTVSASVDGTIPYDTDRLWQMALMGAITGAIGGLTNWDRNRAGSSGEEENLTDLIQRRPNESLSAWNQRTRLEISNAYTTNYSEYATTAETEENALALSSKNAKNELAIRGEQLNGYLKKLGVGTIEITEKREILGATSTTASTASTTSPTSPTPTTPAAFPTANPVSTSGETSTGGTKLSFAPTLAEQQKALLVNETKGLITKVNSGIDGINTSDETAKSGIISATATARTAFEALRTQQQTDFSRYQDLLDKGLSLGEDQERAYLNKIREYDEKLIALKKTHSDKLANILETAKSKIASERNVVTKEQVTNLGKEVDAFVEANPSTVASQSDTKVWYEGKIAEYEALIANSRETLGKLNERTDGFLAGAGITESDITDFTIQINEFAGKVAQARNLQANGSLEGIQDLEAAEFDLFLDSQELSTATQFFSDKCVLQITIERKEASVTALGDDTANDSSTQPPTTPVGINVDVSTVTAGSLKSGDKIIVGGKNATITSVTGLSPDSQGNNTVVVIRYNTADAPAYNESRILEKAPGQATPVGTTLSELGVSVYTPSQTTGGAGSFVLLSSTPTSGSGASAYNNSNNSGFGSTQNSGMNALMQIGMGVGAGSATSSPLWGALAGAASLFFWEWMNAQDNVVQYADSFVMPLVLVGEVTLESPDGVGMEVGEVTYDYDSFYGGSAGATQIGSESTTGSSNSSSSSSGMDSGTSGTNSSAYTGNVLYNPQALTATLGQVEIRELTFSNPGQLTNKDVYQPFVGILKVTGTEDIYETEYDYDDVKEAVEARGELEEEEEDGGTFGSIMDFFAPPNTNLEEIAQITSEDLEVEETRNYEKKFHLLFDSWEYVECGPKTYACPATELANCTVGTKSGSTGTEAVPKILLDWDWTSIDADTCDSENNSKYVYCDSTQFTMSLVKSLMKLREFFKTNSLTNCPTANDTFGKTQALNANALDVGITSVQIVPSGENAVLETLVETNNNTEMSAKLTYVFTRQDGFEVSVCGPETKTFTSGVTYACSVEKSIVGEGLYNVDIRMEPTLCARCENNDTSNDTIKTAVAIGSTGIGACREYKTNRDYFEKVLSANGLQNSTTGQDVLKLLSFKANLVRDAFSADFKEDFDAFANVLAGVPTEYRTGEIRDLFLSDKFQVKWPKKPDAWEAGKYDAKVIIEFANNNWAWDNNNIKSITIDLAPQGDPDPFYPIYNVAFDGMVGVSSDDGRQGYGSGFVQKTEDLFKVNNTVTTQPNARSNGVTNVNVYVQKGVEAFLSLNSSVMRGDVLSIERVNDTDVEFIMTPSLAVPLILNITRNQGSDAFAFYAAEVNGQPQDTGASFISWNGIGQGCVAFDGSPMKGYSEYNDTKASNLFAGYDGYGIGWAMVDGPSGTASFYGSFFTPQDTSTVLRITGSADSAEFESTHGNGNLIQVNTTGQSVKTLKEVMNKVKTEEICVIDGHYFWNNKGLREEMIGTIQAKEQNCMTAR